jgi:hypothetical protein
MQNLDEIALNIELVLISIIEGVALTKLAENAVPVLNGTSQLAYLPFVLAGLAILLVFWAQAILHAVSFIRWPLKMEHMFLYFIAAFLQVIAYANIEHAASWFFWWSVFSVLALFIYAIDLRIIREAGPKLHALTGGAAFVATVEARHSRELKILVPVALAFNVVAFLFVWLRPDIFATQSSIAVLGTLQFLISCGALVDCMRNFASRSTMLEQLHR